MARPVVLFLGVLLPGGLGLLGACSDSGSSSGPGPASERRPNVLLISLDSLRADFLSSYGHVTATGLPTSPNLDALAARSLRFEDVVSTTSWTEPAHHALFSGLPDVLHGAFDDFHGPSPDRVVLAQELRSHGYATAGYFSGLYLHPAHGFDTGFDVYENVTGIPFPYDQDEDQRDADEAQRQLHDAISAHKVTAAGVQFLESHEREDTEQPFFLFLHYFDVHYDYRPDPETHARMFWPGGTQPRFNGTNFLQNPGICADMTALDLAGVKSYYEGEIHWVDEQLGKLLARLDTLGLAQDTIVAVVSDHGDEFFEHGTKGHRQNLYVETLAVPWILHVPGLAAGTVADRVSLVDVTPTLLDLVGIEPARPSKSPLLPHGMLGRSARPLWEGKEHGPRDAFGYLHSVDFETQRNANSWAMWSGRYKVVVTVEWAPGSKRSEVASVHGEVYDVVADPGEHRPLDPALPAVAAAISRYEERYAELFAVAGKLAAGPMPSGSDAERERQRKALESLGYHQPERVSEQPPPAAFPRSR